MLVQALVKPISRSKSIPTFLLCQEGYGSGEISLGPGLQALAQNRPFDYQAPLGLDSEQLRKLFS